MRAVLGWGLALGCGLYLAVMAVANVVLNTSVIPRAITGTDPDWSMKWRLAYSIWPTRLHLLDFKLTGQDPNIQLEYDQARADVTIDLPGLFHSIFRATSVRGSGARFRLRERLVPGGLDPEAISVLPPIEGFSDPPLRLIGPAVRPTADAVLEKELAGWFEDVDVSVNELWIDGFRFQGQGEAYGSFHIKPSVDVGVDGHFQLGFGTVARGALPVVADLAGSLSVFVHRFDPRQHQGKDAVHSVDGSTRLWGSLSDVKALEPLLGTGADAPRIQSEPGTAELWAEFAGGRVLPHTWLRLASDHLSVAWKGFQLSGPFESTLQVEQVANAFPMGIERLTLGPSQVKREGSDQTLLLVQSTELAASSATLDLLDDPLSDLGWSARVLGGEAPDLALLQEVLPTSPALTFRAGRARFNGEVWNPYCEQGHALARVAAEDLNLVAGPLELRGDVLLAVGLQGDAAGAEVSDLLGPEPFDARLSAGGHLAIRPLGAPRDVTAPGRPLRFSVNGSVGPFVPSRADARHLLARTSGRATVAARLRGLDFLNGWSKMPRGWVFGGGGGTLDVDARMVAGHLTPGSRLAARLEDWSAEKNSLRARGSLGLDGSVQAVEGRRDLKATLSLDPYSIESKGDPAPLVQGKRFEVVAEGPSDSLGDLSHKIDLSGLVQAEAPDLTRFNRFLGNPGEFAVGGGSAELNASLQGRRGGRVDGQLQISGKRVEVDLSGRRVTANWTATSHLQQARFPAGAIALRDGSLKIDDLSMDDGSQGWWSQVDVEGELIPGRDQRVRLHFGVKARDIAPLLSLYGTQLGLARWLHSYFAMKGFEASGHLEAGNGEVAIEDFRGTGGWLEVLGQLKLQGGQKWGDVVVNSGPLALGFELRDDDTSLKWFNARSWYQGRLNEGLEQERPRPAAVSAFSGRTQP